MVNNLGYKFTSTKKELEEKGIQTLNNFEKLNKEMLYKQNQLEKLTKLEKEREFELKELEVIKKRYFEKRSQITNLRKKFVQEVLADTENIRIDIKKFRDKKHFETQFRKIIQKGAYTEEIKKIIEFCFNGNVEKQIPKLITKFNDVRLGKTDELIHGKFKTVIKNLNEEQMDELILLCPEDEVEVKYKANKSAQFRPLSNASAGQKTSAILTFLLSYGDIPLILDQPEDDLDNSLIYELIVERLKVCKSKRQIIIVTHNANIPVNGDSELVLVMDSNSNGLNLLASGSIEDRVIRDQICLVMEGGEAAFKLRAKRYKLPY